MVSEVTEAQQAHFRHLLEKRRQAIAADIDTELGWTEHESYRDLMGQVGDLEDQALADLLIDENLANIHRHVRELREIDVAIARIDAGFYGECVDCGETIDPKRLEAYPTAVRCIECQSIHERTHAEPSHPTL